MTKDQDGTLSTGSGFVVRSDGLIVTAEHVIDHWLDVRVRFADGTVKAAVPVWFWRVEDIAILKVAPPVPRPLPLQPDMAKLSLENIFFPPQGIRQGQEVLVLGYPLVHDLGAQDLTVTRGIVSSLRKDPAGFGGLIQIDAAVNPGVSGGPMVNTAGQVLGFVTSRLKEASLVGFGIAASEITLVLDHYARNRHPLDLFVRSPGRQDYEQTYIACWPDELGRPAAPIREVGEKAGATVEYDAIDSTIVARHESSEVIFQVGTTRAVVNGNAIDLGVKTQGDYAWAPIKVLIEGLGGTVRFDYRNGAAYIDMQ